MGIISPHKKHPVSLLDVFLFVVLKSEISKNFDGIVGEVEKWAEILEK